MKKVLTIAGSDCSGGAGIQADLKTFSAHCMYGMSAITALTAQNTTGVRSIHEVPANFLADQLDMIFEDIVPDAVKIGMVSSSALITTIATKLKEHGASNIVVDPVMVATSGSKLLGDEAITALKAQLLPLCRMITHNIPEAEVLCGYQIKNPQDMERAARDIAKNLPQVSVLVKGGHLAADADDYLHTEKEGRWFHAQRIDTPNTHGTGCTLSSAIACHLAAGQDLFTAVQEAKAYLVGALSTGLDLGQGSGPLNHSWWTTNCSPNQL